MRNLLILFFAAISLTVTAQDAADNQHAYISDEDVAKLLKSDDDLSEYQVHNDTLTIRKFDWFIENPISRTENLDEYLSHFDSPKIVFVKDGEDDDETIYTVITTPHSKCVIFKGFMYYNEPKKYYLLVQAEIGGEVTLSNGLKIGSTLDEFFDKTKIQPPVNYNKLKQIVLKWALDDVSLTFDIKDGKISYLKVVTDFSSYNSPLFDVE